VEVGVIQDGAILSRSKMSCAWPICRSCLTAQSSPRFSTSRATACGRAISIAGRAATRGGRAVSQPDSEHDAGTNCMNCAAGVTENGDILVACSGWDGRGRLESREHTAAVILCCRRPQVLRRRGNLVDDFDLLHVMISGFSFPYGNIVGAADGALCITA